MTFLSRPNYIKSALTAVGLTLLSLTAVADPVAQEFPPAQVEVARAEERLMAPLIDVSGTVISINDSRISSEVEGALLWLADVGASVQEGDIIAKLDPRIMTIQHDQAAANLKRLEADMVFREQEVLRFQELSATNNASKARLSEVIARRDMLEQDIIQAKATLERAKGDLDRTAIKAPFGGHVVERLANKGEYLITGSPVIRLIDTSNLEVVLPAPLAVAPHLRKTDHVAVHTGLDTYELPVRTVVPVGDPSSRMVEVRLTVDQDDWLVGTPVKISLPKETPARAVAVPRDALVLRNGQTYIYRIKADNTAEQIRANIGATVGLWVSIVDGIEPGDRVVIRGAERLQPGQPISIK